MNFAGNPALAIPIPVSEKTVPVTSLQLIGQRSSEAELLNAGRLIEAGVQDFGDRPAVAGNTRDIHSQMGKLLWHPEVPTLKKSFAKR